MDKLTKEMQTLFGSLSQFPQLPSGQNFGRLDRMLNQKLKQFEKEHAFDAAATCKSYVAELELLRACCKAGLGLGFTNVVSTLPPP